MLLPARAKELFSHEKFLTARRQSRRASAAYLKFLHRKRQIPSENFK
jgi:hypothetical protein